MSLAETVHSKHERLIVIGDVHGDAKSLLALFHELKPTKKDLIVSVGDLIDRGNDSAFCLDMFTNNSAMLAVRGNHEQFLTDYVDSPRPSTKTLWDANGGEWATNLPMAYLAGLASKIKQTMPFMLTIHFNGAKYGFVHAEAPSNDWEIAYSMVAAGNNGAIERGIWGRDRIRSGIELNVSNVDYVISGHTVQINGLPKRLGNQIWIDTGGLFMYENNTLALTALVIDKNHDKYYVQVKHDIVAYNKKRIDYVDFS